MSVDMFEDLLRKVTPHIQKQDTHLRQSIPAAERLSVTLRHLATGTNCINEILRKLSFIIKVALGSLFLIFSGESQESLHLSFRLGQSTISGIVKETVKAIYKVLAPDYLKFPNTEEEWKAVAQDYETRWNFPNCLGALDGKHCRIDPPLQSGSMFRNYKDTFSIVLLALVDAQLRFIFVDIGTNGRASDRGIWNKSDLKKCLDNNTMSIPGPSRIHGTAQEFPYVILGDEGFTLSERLLIPYPKDALSNRRDRRIFNYRLVRLIFCPETIMMYETICANTFYFTVHRLSRGRRCSENAFGVLGARFQIFRAPMRYDPDDARDVVLATVCLHNYLRTHSVGRAMYTPPNMLDMEDEVGGTVQLGDYRNEPAHGMVRFVRQGGNRHTDAALALRDMWCAYFNTIGRVPGQEKMIDAQRISRN